MHYSLLSVLLLFLLSATLLITAGFVFVKRHAQKLSRADQVDRNLTQYREIEREILEQQSQGLMDEQQAKILLSEAKQQLIIDAENIKTLQTDTALKPDSTSTGRPTVFYLCCLLIPTIGLLLYLPVIGGLGQSDYVQTANNISAFSKAMQANQSVDALRQMAGELIRDLEGKAKSYTDDTEVLSLLANFYDLQGQTDKVIDTYEKMLDHYPSDPNIHATLAQAKYLKTADLIEAAGGFDQSNNDSLRARVSVLANEIDQHLTSALEQDPNHLRALQLRAMQMQAMGEHQEAAKALIKARNLSEHSSPMWQQFNMYLMSLLEQYPSLKSLPELASLESSAETQKPKEGAIIAVELNVDEALLKKYFAEAPSNTTVFVFVRTIDGNRMPLAAKRLTLGELPTTLEITDKDTLGNRSLAQFEQLLIGARISRSGNATIGKGDLQSTPVIVEVQKGKTEVSVLINQEF